MTAAMCIIRHISPLPHKSSSLVAIASHFSPTPSLSLYFITYHVFLNIITFLLCPFLLSVIAAYHLRLRSTLATLTDAVFIFSSQDFPSPLQIFYSYSKSSVSLFPP